METKSPDGMPTVTFSYDLAGRLKKASTPVVAGNPASGDWEFEFDTAGRLVLEISPDAKEVAYDPDENGNITKITYPDSYYVERFYDEMNRLTDIKLNGDTDPAAHFTYDSLSRRLSIEYNNSTEIDYAYEWNDDMSSIEQLFNGSSVEFTYGFNTSHQVESQTVSDAQHMWHPSTTGATTYTTANEVNQYPSVGGKEFTYNRNGCLTSDGDMLFNYDTENHLTTAIRCDGMSTYVYDPMHRQIQKKVGCSSKTRFIYSGWQRIADYDGEDTLENRYVYGTKLDEPLIQVSGTGELSYFHHDRLGSIIAITDDTGTVVKRYAYSPWGECDDMSGTSFGFTGQRYDAESGLYFYKGRYYSPKIGRFLQPDRIGYKGSQLNLFRYVDNDPLNKVDPMGEALVGWAAMGAIALILGLLLWLYWDNLLPPSPVDDGGRKIVFFDADVDPNQLTQEEFEKKKRKCGTPNTRGWSFYRSYGQEQWVEWSKPGYNSRDFLGRDSVFYYDENGNVTRDMNKARPALSPMYPQSNLH